MGLNQQERKMLVGCLLELQEGHEVETFVIIAHTHEKGECTGVMEIGSNALDMVPKILVSALQVCQDNPPENWDPDVWQR